MYEVRPKVIQDFTVICGLDSPVARKLRPKRRFQTRPCRRRRASVGFPYSRFGCAPASCGFAQHVVRTLPSLWTGASPCCTVSQSDTQNLLCTGYIKIMVQFQKLTRNLFLTLHGHNVHRQQRQLSKFLMHYQQFASHA